MERLRNIGKQESGVSIVFACLLLVVLFVLGGIIVAFGYSNLNRSTTAITVEQNYQTVSSASSLAVAEIGGTEYNGTPGSLTAVDSSRQWTADALNGGVSQIKGGDDFATVNIWSSENNGLYTVYLAQDDDPSGVVLRFNLQLRQEGSVLVAKIITDITKDGE